MITNNYRIKSIISKVVDNRGRNTDYFDFEKYPIIDNYMIKNEIHPALETATRFLSEDQYHTFLRGYIDSNDLLMTLVGNGIGNVTLSPHSKCAIVQNTIGLAFDKSICDQIYIYYYFKTIQTTIRNLDRGSSQPSVNREDIFRLRVQLPNITIQKKIVSILSAYDNLIEVNNKRIKVLEQMAENLYKEWFVRFRFPGHETAKFENGIPKGWVTKTLSEWMCENFNGGWGEEVRSSKASDEASVIRGTDIDDVKAARYCDVPLRYHKVNDIMTKRLKEDDIILELSNGNINNIGRTLYITKEILKHFGNVICASFCKTLRFSDRNIAFFVWQYIEYLQKSGLMSFYKNTGANGINNFNFKRFLRLPISIPRNFTNFESLMQIYNEISIIREKNFNLTHQRDMLLPRLMSGKLEVS